ncbi:MAG: 5-(carboxyamino)imidazole ribonucleotide mutase [Oscillospiraceae bacterium]|nr:5-(carboxyamino)imidazole ribonucleotide mutase [Oscillospiraceae bacterium]
MRKIGIIMGSTSDMPIMQKAIELLDEFDVPFEVHAYSAHRTPAQVIDFATGARKRGFGVIIGAAGMAAHLSGVIAANTTLPVIAVPLSGKNLDGLDALLSSVQMPTGIPVATVAIDGAANAALLAMEIIAIGEPDLGKKLEAYRLAETKKRLKQNADIEAKYNKTPAASSDELVRDYGVI